MSAVGYQSICNAIALAALILDTRDWPLAEKCYAAYCIVEYPPPMGVANGVAAYVENAKIVAHDRLSTMHRLTTQHIEIKGEDAAETTTYFDAKHWHENGKDFTAYGKYVDKLVKGGDGVWKIKERKVTPVGRSPGDPSVFESFPMGKPSDGPLFGA